MALPSARRCRVCGLLLVPVLALSSGASIAANLAHDRDPLMALVEPFGPDDRFAIASNSSFDLWPRDQTAVMSGI